MLRIQVFRKSDGSLREAPQSDLPGLLVDEGSISGSTSSRRPRRGRCPDGSAAPPPAGDRDLPRADLQRPIQDFDDHLLLTVHEARLPRTPQTDPFETAEMDVVLGRRFLMTTTRSPWTA